MKWFKVYRENDLIEVVCEHGVAHPSRLMTPTMHLYTIHGCDGCCAHAEFARAEDWLAHHAHRDSVHIPDDLDEVIE